MQAKIGSSILGNHISFKLLPIVETNISIRLLLVVYATQKRKYLLQKSELVWASNEIENLNFKTNYYGGLGNPK